VAVGGVDVLAIEIADLHGLRRERQRREHEKNR
jgi:hypothetical protein